MIEARFLIGLYRHAQQSGGQADAYAVGVECGFGRAETENVVLRCERIDLLRCVGQGGGYLLVELTDTGIQLMESRR